MSDDTRALLGRAMAGVAVAGALVGMVWLVVLGVSRELWEDWMVHNALIALSAGVITWLVIPSQPRNGAVWLLGWAALLTGLEVATYAIVTNHMISSGMQTSFFDLVPSQLPVAVALVAMQANWLWIGIFLLLAVPHVFPDGRTRPGGWGTLFRVNLAVVALTAFGLFWQARPSGSIPLGDTQDTHGGFESVLSTVVTLGYPLSFVLGAAGMVAMLLRYRESTGVQRQQFRWVAWGASATGIAMLVSLVVDEVFDRTDVALFVGAMALTSLVVAVGIAIGRYRIYDIDAVISRTFVYSALAAFITAVYVGIVVGAGLVLGTGDEPNTWLGILATVVIAIVFQPLRRWLQKVANRIVYGRRASPYEVLSSFAQGVSVVDPAVLEEVARSLTSGTTAISSSIWMGRDGDEQLLASWPHRGDGTAVQVESVDVFHDGDLLGRVTLEFEPGQPVLQSDGVLLEQVASGLGLALRNLLLTEDLKDRVEELAASRRRVVAVQDETRRRLERDLHDGAQQRLVALKIKLGIGVSVAQKKGLDDVTAMLEMVKSETDRTIEAVRDFARGIYPPLLEAEGLEAALTSPARGMPVPVSIHARGLGRYPKEIEATVYFCVLEALQNAIKHASASSIQVRLGEEEGQLKFEVIDDGAGFEPDSVSKNGLLNMRDRLEAVGGHLTIDSRPGRGSRIAASVRVPAEVAS